MLGVLEHVGGRGLGGAEQRAQLSRFVQPREVLGHGALVSRSLMAGRSAPVLGVWYMGFTAIAFTSAYLFVMLRSHVTPNLTGAGLQFGATLVLYPFAHMLIDRFEDADPRFR